MVGGQALTTLFFPGMTEVLKNMKALRDRRMSHLAHPTQDYVLKPASVWA
jgi:hypothetical protein